MNARLCSVWCRSEEPFFHVVSNRPNKLSLIDYWVFPSLNFTSWNDIAFSARWAKMECSPEEATRLSIRFVNIVSKVWAFGSVVFRFCSVSDKFFNSLKTSAISAKLLTKFWWYSSKSGLFCTLSRFVIWSFLKILRQSWKRMPNCWYCPESWSDPANSKHLSDSFESHVQIMRTSLFFTSFLFAIFISSHLFFGNWLYSEYKCSKNDWKFLVHVLQQAQV